MNVAGRKKLSQISGKALLMGLSLLQALSAYAQDTTPVQTVPVQTLAVQASAVQTPANPSVFCTVRINSNDEIEDYKKSLEPQGVQFVELTEFGTKLRPAVELPPDAPNKNVLPMYGDDWFDNACKKVQRCDALLISGHYGGGFVGPETTGLTLLLSTMERHACDRTCEGILHAPTKVHLMGCNTLALKALQRTRDEQFQAYIDDGYDPRVASMMVASLYSDIGRTSRERMQFIFSGVPQIYGFITRAPLGAQISPMLEQYLSAIPDWTGTLTDARTNPAAVDDKLSIFPSWVGYRIAPGFKQDDPAWPFTQKTCQLYTAKTKMGDKLNAVQELLASPEKRKYYDEVAEFMNRTRGTEWSGSEQRKIKNISQLPGVKEDFLSVLPTIGETSPYMFTQFSKMAVLFGWMTTKEQRQQLLLLVQGLAKNPINHAIEQDVCSLGWFRDLKMEEIPEAWYSASEGLRAIGCLRPEDKHIYRKVADALNSQDPEMVKAATEVLTTIKTFYAKVGVPFDGDTKKMLKKIQR